MNIHEITLDVSKEPAHEPTLYIAQGDKNGTTLVVHMYDNGQVLTLTGKTVAFCMRTPDGLDYYQVAGTVSGNVATFLIDETYAAGHPGITNIAYVTVANGTTEITSSSRIQVAVLPSAKDAVEPAPAYVSLIEQFLNEAQAEIDEAVAAAEAIVDYNVPLMSANQRGGAKLGSGLDVTDEVLSVDITPSDINAYTKTETDDAIAASAARAYKAAGSVTFANLPRTLIASMLGYVYNIEDSFTIDSSVQSIFVEQSGTFPAGTNVVVIDTDTTGTNPTYKYDVIAGFIDLSGYVETSDVINIAHGGTGATTAANAAAAIVDGQAIAPANVTATGAIQGSSISDGTGTLAALRESVSPRVLFDDSWAPNTTQNLGAVSSYQLYVVFSDGGATPMLGVPTPMSGGGFFLRVDGGYSGTDGSHTSYMAAFTISSAGVWTLLSCNYLGHSVGGNHGGAHQVNVGRVVRLL